MNAELSSQPHDLPKWIEPMRAKWVRTLPDAGDWMYELKLDGYRALAIRDGKNVSLVSRNRNDLSTRFPAVIEALRKLKLQQFVLDSEVVALDEKGRPSFQKLQRASRSGLIPSFLRV